MSKAKGKTNNINIVVAQDWSFMNARKIGGVCLQDFLKEKLSTKDHQLKDKELFHMLDQEYAKSVDANKAYYSPQGKVVMKNFMYEDHSVLNTLIQYGVRGREYQSVKVNGSDTAMVFDSVDHDAHVIIASGGFYGIESFVGTLYTLKTIAEEVSKNDQKDCNLLLPFSSGAHWTGLLIKYNAANRTMDYHLIDPIAASNSPYLNIFQHFFNSIFDAENGFTVTYHSNTDDGFHFYKQDTNNTCGPNLAAMLAVNGGLIPHNKKYNSPAEIKREQIDLSPAVEFNSKSSWLKSFVKNKCKVDIGNIATTEHDYINAPQDEIYININQGYLDELVKYGFQVYETLYPQQKAEDFYDQCRDAAKECINVSTEASKAYLDNFIEVYYAREEFITDILMPLFEKYEDPILGPCYFKAVIHSAAFYTQKYGSEMDDSNKEVLVSVIQSFQDHPDFHLVVEALENSMTNDEFLQECYANCSNQYKKTSTEAAARKIAKGDQSYEHKEAEEETVSNKIQAILQKQRINQNDEDTIINFIGENYDCDMVQAIYNKNDASWGNVQGMCHCLFEDFNNLS